MERRNLIIIAIAVVLGLIAVFVANSWFSGVEKRQAIVAEQQKLARIAVARVDLPFGTQLTADNVRLVNWPQQSVPAGAYADVSKLVAAGRVTIRPIAAGEPILPERISARAVLSANLPDNMRAVTVPVDAVAGVAGFVTPGDVVDVMLTRQIPGDGATAQDKMTTILLENVPVLASDTRASDKDTEPQVPKTATLQVDQRGAQKLALAVETGKLTLALRNAEDQIMGGTSAVTVADLGGGGRYIRARSPAPAAPRAPAYSGSTPVRTAVQPASTVNLAPLRTGPTMTVIRGTDQSTAEVQHYGR